MVDDLGYNDLAINNGNENIDTPNLDALATEGVRYTRNYANPACSPARAVLLTGLYPERVGYLPNGRDRLMTDDELQRLIHVLETDSARTPRLVIKWYLYTACRKGEALHLRWADINRDANTWTIQAARAKSKKRRVVPLNSGALDILDELSHGNDSEWVFLNSRNGERLQSIDKIWQRVRSSAVLPDDIVIHSLRHQGASMMLASGADLATVRDILGHADISTTEKYLHASGQSLRGGAESIEDYLENALANGSS